MNPGAVPDCTLGLFGPMQPLSEPETKRMVVNGRISAGTNPQRSLGPSVSRRITEPLH